MTGHSAGGHLALMAGMLTASAGFDNNCAAGPSEPPLKVAAIVSWFGISDVADLLSGLDRRNYALMWLGGQGKKASRMDMARRLSPMSYVRPGLPPIILIHGTADPTVPYSQAIQLHEALDRDHDVNKLVSIPGGKLGVGITDASFHTLRHTAASWMVMQGVDLYAVGQLLGHKTPRMTQRYAHLSPDYMAGAVNKLDGIMGGMLPAPSDEADPLTLLQ